MKKYCSIFALKLNLVAMVCCLVLVGFSCRKSIEDEPIDQEENQENETSIAPLKYLALGDSYTIGQGVAKELRWPNQLTEELKAAGFEVVRNDIIARTGWTTTNLLDATYAEELDDYNLVSLLIGVNNQFQGKAFSLFENEFDSLLNWSISIAGSQNRVFVVSIPDYGVTPYGQSEAEKIAKELDQYNVFMKKQCEARSIPFIDITGISRELKDEEGALAPDDLHPSGSQYTQWVEKILPVVTELLKG